MTTFTTTAAAEPPRVGPARADLAVGIIAPGPNGRERVAGVSLVRRAAIVLERAGCGSVRLRSIDPLDAAELKGRAQPLATGASDAWAAPRVIAIVGDVAAPVPLLRALVEASQRGAFVANEAGLVFVAPGSIAKEILGGDADPIADVIARARAALDERPVAGLLAARTKAERKAATRSVLRATGKAADGPLTRLFERRISQAISGLLLPLPVSPNFMTTVSCIIGLSGAGLLATTDWVLRVIGAALFVFATIVDGCDGEIARSKFLESPFGKLYDTGVDILVNAAVFVGIGIGTWRELHGVSEVQLATLLLVGGGVFAMAVVESVRRIAPTTTAESVLGRARGWLETFATVEWCYLVLALAILNQIPFFFFGAAVGANVFALVYLVLGAIAWHRA